MTDMIYSYSSVIGNSSGGLSISGGVVQMEAVTSLLVVVSRTVRRPVADYLLLKTVQE